MRETRYRGDSPQRRSGCLGKALGLQQQSEVVLRTDAGEQLLRAGCCAGFPAGSGDGHQLVNRSDRPAVYLEVGSRHEADAVFYPDADVVMHCDPAVHDGRFTRKNGTPC